jgi:hypothetical protein
LQGRILTLSQALLNLRKEFPDKSKYFFSYIIATQLSAQKHGTLGQESASNLASNLAYRFLSNALKNGSVESVRLEGTEIEIPPSPLTSSRDRLIEYPLPENYAWCPRSTASRAVGRNLLNFSPALMIRFDPSWTKIH